MGWDGEDMEDEARWRCIDQASVCERSEMKQKRREEGRRKVDAKLNTHRPLVAFSTTIHPPILFPIRRSKLSRK